MSDTSGGLDSNLLNSNVASSSVNKTLSLAQSRIKLKARLMAETGIKDMFTKLHNSIVRSSSKESAQEMFELNGTFVPVDPSKWKNRKDLKIRVGLGHGSIDQKLMYHNMIIGNMERVGNSFRTNADYP